MASDTTRFALIVEDDPLTSALLASTLEAKNFVTEIAESAGAARDILKAFDPDVAIIDLDLGRGPTGIDVAHFLANVHPHVARLVLTKYPDLVSAGFEANALPDGTGMLPKDAVTEVGRLVEAISEVLQDEPRVRSLPMASELKELTAQQRQILRLLAQGYTVAEIARRRGTSGSAVEKSITAIYGRLGIGSDPSVSQRAEAIRRYVDAVGLPDRTGHPDA